MAEAYKDRRQKKEACHFLKRAAVAHFVFVSAPQARNFFIIQYQRHVKRYVWTDGKKKGVQFFKVRRRRNFFSIGCNGKSVV